MRRVLVVLALAAGALALAGARPAHADAGSPPVVTQWSPQTVTAGGQPLRITVVGSNLSGVTQVFTTPVVPSRSVAVISDEAVVVTLPGGLAPGEYGIELVSDAGSTLPGSIEVTVLPAGAAAPPGGGGSDAAPAAAPVSLPPAPVAVEATPKAAPAGQPQPAAASGSSPPAAAPGGDGSGGPNPLVVLAVGILVGGLLYALWGKEGRLRVARRRGFLAQAWARPLQRLQLARICLQCGKLHFIFRTRRDLWSAGDFCSAACFVADQEKEHDLASSQGVAPTRLRGVGVYTDLELSLQSALRGEASAHAALLFGEEPEEVELSA